MLICRRFVFTRALIFPYDELDFAAQVFGLRCARKRNPAPAGPEMLYFFEDFALDPDRRELRRGGAVIAVQPQVFDLLEYLIANRDRVVSKDDILQAVWGGRIVSESALTTRINATRTAVCDDGDQQRLIRTLPRKGIRFVGVVQERARPVDEATAAPAVVDKRNARTDIGILRCGRASGAPPAHHCILRAVARGGGRHNGPGGFKRDYRRLSPLRR